MRSLVQATHNTILLFLAVVLSVFAAYVRPAFAEYKAFVVGLDYLANNQVPHLKNSAYSAQQMARTLTNYGYKTTLVPENQAALNKLSKAWKDFVKTVNSVDQAVVYFSGHGLSSNNNNYFVPLDVNPDALQAVNASLDDLLIPLQRLVADINKQSPKAVVWIIDACRDDP